ncbi:MAG TPA: hypothetical protein DDZ83_03500, partial [Nitrospinae bacterium]|nr:hypothetical protein [Nitrospinota bacterium]
GTHAPQTFDFRKKDRIRRRSATKNRPGGDSLRARIGDISAPARRARHLWMRPRPISAPVPDGNGAGQEGEFLIRWTESSNE